MGQQAHFGVLETAWNIGLPDPQPAEDKAETLHYHNSLETLPFTPYMVSGLPESVVVEYCRTTQRLFSRSGSDSSTNLDATVELIARYRFPDGRHLVLTQYIPPAGNAVVYRAAAGMSQQVPVGEASGLLIQGRWHAEKGSKTARWDPIGGATVLWMVANRALTLFGEKFTADAVLSLACSVRLDD